MKIEAFGTHVILKNIPAPKKVGLIELPASMEQDVELRCVGEVVSVGPDVTDLKEGDVVAYWNRKADGIQGRDTELLRWVRREDVVGRVVEDEVATKPEQLAKLKECAAEHRKVEAMQAGGARLAVAR